MRRGFEKVMAAVEGRAGVLREESDRATLGSERPTTQPEVCQGRQEGGGAVTPKEAMLSRQRKTNNRPDPLLLAEEPLPDDEAVLWPRVAADCRVAAAQGQVTPTRARGCHGWSRKSV